MNTTLGSAVQQISLSKMLPPQIEKEHGKGYFDQPFSNCLCVLYCTWVKGRYRDQPNLFLARAHKFELARSRAGLFKFLNGGIGLR